MQRSRIPEVLALHVLWHDRDDAGSIKRAIKAREYVVSEERAGRNVLVRAAETFSVEPWREGWWKRAQSVTDALAHAKLVTYVDDCDLDAAKPLRTLIWKVVRTQCAAKNQHKCTDPVAEAEEELSMGSDNSCCDYNFVFPAALSLLGRNPHATAVARSDSSGRLLLDASTS